MNQAHVLVAVDAFTQLQVETIGASCAPWATWERLPENAAPETYRARLVAAEIVIGWLEPAWIRDSPIKLLLSPSVGYEGYLGQGLEAKADFTLCNAGDVYAEGIAEHGLALMFALTRRLPQYIRAMQAQSWQQLPGHAVLDGSTVCIVGLGSIGSALARRCAALNLRVIGVRRKVDEVDPAVQAIYPPERITEAVAQADHIVAALPGGQATFHLFNQAVFDAMKPGAYFYNVGRGSTVDETELVRHLLTGRLAGAGLDVFASEPLPRESPLWLMSNVIVTPHMAGYTADYAPRLVALLSENLRRYHAGEPLLNVVNLAGGYV